MSSISANTKASGRRKMLGMVLLSMGLYAIVLGLTVGLALASWPGAGSNDSTFGIILLALFLLFGGSLLFLVSLLFLKVHWLLVIGMLLLALLAAYVQGRLFPAGPAYGSTNWILTFGGIVLVLSFILLSRVRGIWPALWRTLLVTGICAGIIFAVAYICGQIAAAGTGSINGQPPPGSPVYPLASVIVGSVDILLVVYWLTRKSKEVSLSD